VRQTDLHERSGCFVQLVQKIRGYAYDRRRGHQPAHVNAPVWINVIAAGHHVFVAQQREHENRLKNIQTLTFMIRIITFQQIDFLAQRVKMQ